MIFYTSKNRVIIKKESHGVFKKIGEWLVPKFYYWPKHTATKDKSHHSIYFAFSVYTITFYPAKTVK